MISQINTYVSNNSQINTYWNLSEINLYILLYIRPGKKLG